MELAHELRRELCGLAVTISEDEPSSGGVTDLRRLVTRNARTESHAEAYLSGCANSAIHGLWGRGHKREMLT